MGKITKWIGDFETSTGNSDGSTNVYLYGAKNTAKTKQIVGVNLHDFFRDIEENDIKHMYFHNLGWDGVFILHYLLENGYEPLNTFTKAHEIENGQFTHLITDMKKIFKIQIRTHTGHLITFGDTAALLPMKVSDMGEILNYPKGEIDYDKYKHFNSIDEVPAELLDYLWRDIDIVVEFYNGFASTFKGHKLTIGSTALDDFKKDYGRLNYSRDFGGKFMTKKGVFYNEVLTKDEWNEYKKYYKGGLTLGNEKIRNIAVDNINGQSIDVNSMYPGVMSKYKLPYGKPLDYKPKGDHIEFLKVWIKSTHKIDDEMPSHLHNPKGRLNSKVKYIDEGSRFFAYYLKEEFEELKKTYQLVEGINYHLIKTTYFNAKYTWKNWVEKTSVLKTEAKDEIQRSSAKLGLNSPYGKQGEKYRKGVTHIIYDDKDIEAGARFGKNNEWVMTTEVVETDEVSYVPAAAAITAYSRVILLQAIRANKKNFLYADTDSIYCSDDIVGVEIHDTEFAKWKPELRFSKFKWVKPKCYLAEVTSEYKKGKWVDKPYLKRAIAGLTIEAQPLINWDNFNEGTEIPKAKIQKKNVKGGLILTKLNYTI